jgi:hypothetical protein
VKIRIKKGTDGSAALTCTRADGSSTWQRQHGAQARFFPRHDLTHYAVETILGHRRGFYGLVAEGWDLADFGTPWPRGPLPADAEPAELIVGFLDAERASGATWTAEELNEKIATYRAQHGTFAEASPLTEPQLAAVRARMHALFAEWDAVPPGDALELEYHVPAR